MIRPKKHLGQHFLHDENIARKIIGYLPDKTVNLLEVGPGTGILTKYLLKDQNFNSFFLEIDPVAVKFLFQTYPEIKERLINADILDYDLSLIPSPFTIIGNFPYNISTQILFRVIEYRKIIPLVIGMFQKEVAERVASPPGSKKYGILSVLLQAYYDIDYLFTVSENVFHPPPEVKSGVIRLRRNNIGKLECNEDLFFKVVKTAFNQRRKTLRNALKSLNTNEPPVQHPFLDKRAEQLSVDDFILLTNAIAFNTSRLQQRRD
jgi:16S rRNA (adenine1518-N6/adenine1519-N6)-dimethyltransferase